jgi:hypothetical protein
MKTGPARAEARQVTEALGALQSAAEDLVLMTDALKRSARAAHQLHAYPMPTCADPAGYWKKSLADTRAGADNASTSSGLGAVLLAMAPQLLALAGRKETVVHPSVRAVLLQAHRSGFVSDAADG